MKKEFWSLFPSHGNPWPNGVSVEWVYGRGWIPCFDQDALELLNDYHAGASS